MTINEFHLTIQDFLRINSTIAGKPAKQFGCRRISEIGYGKLKVKLEHAIIKANIIADENGMIEKPLDVFEICDLDGNYLSHYFDYTNAPRKLQSEYPTPDKGLGYTRWEKIEGEYNPNQVREFYANL